MQRRVEDEDDSGALAALGLVYRGGPGRLELGEVGEAGVADDAAECFFLCEKERGEFFLFLIFFVEKLKSFKNFSKETNSPSVEGDGARVVGQLDARHSPVVV